MDSNQYLNSFESGDKGFDQVFQFGDSQFIGFIGKYYCSGCY